jgi:hypothetical protein
LENDLLASLKELLDVSQAMTNGSTFSADDMVRYQRSVEWATRVIALAEIENH